jgi:antitoxin component YwqK of YwqJK toxin-antitoxin module
MVLEVRIGMFPSGSVKYERMFLNDKPYGIWKEYYEDGKFLEQLEYDNKGKLNGILKKWHPNGHLFSEYSFKDGAHHGMSREWYDNGNIAYEANYEEGEIKGTAKSWSKNGTLLTEKFYYGIKNEI